MSQFSCHLDGSRFGLTVMGLVVDSGVLRYVL